MNGGRRNQLDEAELVGLYSHHHGPFGFLHHQVHRTGNGTCSICGQTYQKHKWERGLLDQNGEPFVHRLCNGDLVKL
jgi:hypothetical protein